MVWQQLVVAGLVAVSTPTAPADDFAAVDRYVAEYADSAGYPGVAVAITKGGEVVHEYGYGHDSTGAAVLATTPMPIASVSKSFTSLAVLRLVEAGEVDLDEPVRRYVPDFRVDDPRGARITVRHLLEQTSGITDGTLAEKSLAQPESLAGAVDRAHAATLAADPGTEYHYTNTNYHLAARVVEVVSGEPFDDYLRRHVFDPAGMRSTTAVIGTTAAGVPDGYTYAYGVKAPVTEPDRFVAGSDGVITTAHDLAKWLVVQSTGGTAPGWSRRRASAPCTPRQVRSGHTGWVGTPTMERCGTTGSGSATRRARC